MARKRGMRYGGCMKKKAKKPGPVAKAPGDKYAAITVRMHPSRLARIRRDARAHGMSQGAYLSWCYELATRLDIEEGLLVLAGELDVDALRGKP
jgi:hypothetical protein